MRPPRSEALANPFLATALGAGLAIVTSAGIVGERLSSGSLRAALASNALMTGTAIVVLAAVRGKPDSSARRSLWPLAIGGAIGIVAVHAALRLGFVAIPPWMSERPAQLVNDAVAVLALLLVVRASARGFDPAGLAFALGLLTVYRLTGATWHLDVSPRTFAVSVQTAVVAHVVAAALALPVFRVARDGV
jgi:hypothetical protein